MHAFRKLDSSLFHEHRMISPASISLLFLSPKWLSFSPPFPQIILLLYSTTQDCPDNIIIIDYFFFLMEQLYLLGRSSTIWHLIANHLECFCIISYGFNLSILDRPHISKEEQLYIVSPCSVQQSTEQSIVAYSRQDVVPLIFSLQSQSVDSPWECLLLRIHNHSLH